MNRKLLVFLFLTGTSIVGCGALSGGVAVTDFVASACPVISMLKQSMMGGGGDASPQNLCQACIYVATTVVPPLSADKSVTDALFAVAPVFLGSVCGQVIQVYKNEIVHVLFPLARKAPDVTCAILLQIPQCTANPSALIETPWTVQLPEMPKTPIKLPKPSSTPFKVLHISDTHLDLNYQAGTSANCIEPVCCHNDSNPLPRVPLIPAGKYGGRRVCNTPVALFSEILDGIVNLHGVGGSCGIGAVYLTGDYPTNAPYGVSKEGHLQTIEKTVEMLKATFGETKVFMTVGNHDAIPTDSFPSQFTPARFGNSWLYTKLAEYWTTDTNWLPNNTFSDISRDGFYTAMLKPGWRVISINDNFCNTGSYWLLLYSKDPFNELRWLVKWLKHAEYHGERVHLISHLPTGDSSYCRQVWSANYYSIVSRFRQTIAHQFFGHEHQGYFTVYYDEETNETPVSVAFQAPSITPYYLEVPGGTFPSYYLYTFDSESLEMISMEQYYVDLDQANREGKVTIKKLLTASQDFGMTDFSPLGWHNFARRLVANDTLFQQFFYNSTALANVNLWPCPDGSECKRNFLCWLFTGRSFDPSLCDRWVPSLNN